jgi:hypothetical protein
MPPSGSSELGVGTYMNCKHSCRWFVLQIQQFTLLSSSHGIYWEFKVGDGEIQIVVA